MRALVFQSTLVVKVSDRAVTLQPRIQLGCLGVFGGVFCGGWFYLAGRFQSLALYVGGAIAIFIVALMFGALLWEISRGPFLVFDRAGRRLLAPRLKLAFDPSADVFLAAREELFEDPESHGPPGTCDALYLCRSGADGSPPLKLGTEYQAGAMRKHLRRIAETTGVRVGEYPEGRLPDR